MIIICAQFGEIFMKYPIIILFTALGLMVSSVVYAAEKPEYTIVLNEHKFIPEVVEIPADTKVKLIVKNEDATPAEFESDDFKREKIIQGNSQGIILVGPLAAGEYTFFDEFNEESAQGKLIVK